ncbi:hypothetical protein CLU79DRAFT_730626 [Phycomyces nitens]|nr:hypothetical protein CLU79DRAFT_730626 [Phycomyces nitens]
MHRFILFVSVLFALVLVTQAVDGRSLKHKVKKYGKKLSKQAPDLLEQYTGKEQKGHKNKNKNKNKSKNHKHH